MKRPRFLLLTPPLEQPNTPYPAMPHLTGFLEEKGFDVHQRDLSVKVVRDILLKFGDATTEELLEFLAGPAPLDAKRRASEIVDELAIRIRETIDPSFGFSRYAEHAVLTAAGFTEIERLVRRRGVLDQPLARHLKAAMEEVRPTVVGVTCPFPGMLVGAFKIARYIRAHYPRTRLLLGGGYVSTELREMTDRRPFKYFDEFQFDEGYGHFSNVIPSFVRPSYRGIDWNDYFDVVETDNPVANLWNSGRWVKLMMARGCYWHRCAFCDVKLPSIGSFKMSCAKEIVDAMESFARPTTPQIPARTDFHFVDEAMPPKVLHEMCAEILRRQLHVTWWGNIRFDDAFTTDLVRAMAKAGCVAVSGGLECANDRLLALMKKGITLAGARRVLKRFARVGIAVHAYLMYGFPTETAEEAEGALEVVRDLFREGLVQSAFWHRFALTVHSPLAHEAARFGLKLQPRPRQGARIFARNEIAFVEPEAPDWAALGADFALAQANYSQGRGLDKPISYWKGKGVRHGS